jgi:hypothetical protein
MFVPTTVNESHREWFDFAKACSEAHLIRWVAVRPIPYTLTLLQMGTK